MTTAADLAAKSKRRTKTVRVNLDGELLGRIDDLRDDLRQAIKEDQQAGEGLQARAPQILCRIRDLELEADATATVFRLRAISGEAFDDLLRQHPPTEADWRRYKEQAAVAPMLIQPPECHLDQVLPRLFGLCVYEIDGETVDWGESDGLILWKDLYDGARANLGNAAWNLNSRSALRPTSGIGTGETPPSDPESTTHPNGASHSRSF